jgi:hypothetical protein
MANFSLNVKINGAEQAVSSIGEIEAALRATKQELKGVEIGSQAFEELSNQARRLQDELKESFKEATNFDKNLGKLGESVGRIGSTVAASFSLVTSAFQVFGSESEELSEAQVKAQQALAIAFSATTIAMNAQKLAGDFKLVQDRLQVGLTNLLVAAFGKETTAKAANAVVTGTATVAQRALNAAMNANPIVLLVTALVALTAAVIAFSSSADEADTSMDKLTEASIDNAQAIRKNKEEINDLINSLIDLRIAQEKDAEKQAELLALRDKNNIDFIDKQIRDNQAFFDRSIQALELFQIKTKLTEDAFYKDRIKFQEDLLGLQLLQLLNEQQSRDERLRNADIENLEEQQLMSKHYLKLVDLQESFLKAQGLLDENNNQEKIDLLRKNLQTSIGLLEKDIATRVKLNINGEKKITEDQRKETEKQEAELKKRRDAWKKAYDDIQKKVNDTFKELTKVEDSYYDKIQELRLKNGKEAVEYQQIVETQKLEELRKTFLQEINLSVLSEKEKEKKILEFEDFYKEAQERQLEFFTIRLEKEQKILDKQAEEIEFIYKTLQDEITVGDQNVYNRREALVIKQKELAIEENRFRAEQEKLNLKSRFDNLSLELKLRQDNNKKLEQLEENRAEAERNQQLENTKKLYQDKFGEEFFQTEKGKAILAQLEINLEEELQIKLQEIREKFGREEINTQRSITEEKIALIQEFVDFAASSANVALDLFRAISDLAKTERENDLIDLRTSNNERLNAINEQYNAELEAQQQALERGLINQEQYNAAILALDTNRTQAQAGLENNLRKAELAAKKKAFEDEKKLRIASTVIAGVQGALQAFAGAFQLGPIAGPIVGGILAALVAATTGIQVAAISKQKFDSSGSVNITAPNASGAGPLGGSGGGGGIPGSAGGFTQFDESLLGPQPGQSGGGGGAADPVKVYVLESDITNTQSRVNVAESNATFG